MIINTPVTSTQASSGSGSGSSNDRDSILQLANENPLGIKIKEITKPEEIRITDDKPKPFNPFKSTTTTTTTTTSTTTSPTTVASTTAAALDVTTETEVKASTESSTITSTTETPKESKELATEDTNQSPNRGEQDYLDNGVLGDNNSSDAPPSVKAQMEPETLLNSGADSNSIADDASNKNVRQIVEQSTSGGDLDQFSDANDFSSTTELSTTESSLLIDASTTERGEETDLTASSTPQNVVLVRHGGKTESFHILGTDGLQRVEELEMDVSSTTENENGNSQESTPRDIETSSTDDGLSSASSEIEVSSTTSQPETLEETGTVSLAKKFDKSLESNDTTGIDNLSNNSIEVSTPDDTIDSSSEFAPSERVYQSVHYVRDEKSTTASPFDDTAYDTVYYPSSSTEDSSESSSTVDISGVESSSVNSGFSTTDQSTTVTATESLSTVKSTSSFDEEPEVTPDENPYYPGDIEVDVSIHKQEEQEEKRRLPSKVLDDTIANSTVGPACDDCDDAKMLEPSSTQGPSDQEIKKSHKNDMVEARVPGEPNLIPEWERNSTEKALVAEASTTLGPSNDIESAELNKTSTSSGMIAEKANQSAALLLGTTVAPIDSDEIYGRKEPTTERSTTKGYGNVNDADDTSSPSSAQQLENSTTDGALPDDDAESIKFTSSGSSDDVSNESYERRPLKFEVSDSVQNFWRHVAKTNGWSFTL